MLTEKILIDFVRAQKIKLHFKKMKKHRHFIPSPSIFFGAIALFFFTLGYSAPEKKLTPPPVKKNPHPIWKALWGKPTMPETPITIIPLMFTHHIEAFGASNIPSSHGGHDNNNPMIAIVYKTFFAGTFVNSFNIRSYSIGIQRYWYEKKLKPNLNFAVGYRLGGILGYQNVRAWPYPQVLRYEPILPLLQIVSDITYWHVGVEFGYTADVVSGSFYFRF